VFAVYSPACSLRRTIPHREPLFTTITDALVSFSQLASDQVDIVAYILPVFRVALLRTILLRSQMAEVAV
jgi:hypothetical protein